MTACVNIRREGRKGGQTAAALRGRKPRPMIGRVAQREFALTGEDVGCKGGKKDRSARSCLEQQFGPVIKLGD